MTGTQCGYGGTGIRTGLKNLYLQGFVGSRPTIRTMPVRLKISGDHLPQVRKSLNAALVAPFGGFLFICPQLSTSASQSALCRELVTFGHKGSVSKTQCPLVNNRLNVKGV